MTSELTPFDGILLVDKPPRLTSHDVVDKVRRHFGFKKVGHCGTLDPLATGLLILVLGKATKLSEKLLSDNKDYEGTLRLGITTVSQDADGKVTKISEVPPLTEEQIKQTFAQFMGDIYQTPPMVSAIKQGGKPLYKLARKGIEVEREPRLVHIFEFRVTDIALPDIKFILRCTKGTYVRTLCDDIGNVLGCGGHLAQLRRSRSGNFSIANAHTLEAILATPRDQLPQWITPMWEVKI
ncbi:MAG: tRNA pseudouridine(55) synthase TruB [Verrucomicrobiae bacterium]|nr:tRNA pseudouridine(55) synthase TruB [Verrucomicrobiae bacterium]